MNGQPTYRQGPVLWRRTYDRVLILVPTSGELVTLTSTGCDLWAALGQPGTVEDIAGRLAAAYGASVSQIAPDIAPVIEELERRGAIVVTDRRR